MKARAPAAAVLLLSAQVAAAMAVLGAPDVGSAWRFLRAGIATEETVTAASVLVLWVVLVGVAAGIALLGIRSLVRRRPRPGLASAAFAVLGLVILAGGLARHAQAGYTQCCGTVDEARQMLTAAGPR